MSTENWDMTIQTNASNVGLRRTNATKGCLVRIHPLELENKLVRITLSKTTIGREPANDIFCDDTSISRNHAWILKTPQGFVIEDRGSTNGTYVDGESVDRCLLTDGCKVQVGNHIFKFLAGNSIESQYFETVYAMMTKDGLTNVYNKRYLIDALSSEFDRSQAYGRPFSLVMMDIDHFKKFNDTYGHLAGDEVLQEFARRIQSECGPNQVLARFGGEEFAVMLIETERSAATEFAESLRTQIDQSPFGCCAGSLEVTASFGVAEFDGQRHQCFTDLIEQADQNLYQAKANGRNQVVCKA